MSKVPRLTEVFIKEIESGDEYNQQRARFDNRRALYDNFSQDFEEFKDNLERELKTDLGPNWKKVIDQGNGFAGAADEAMKQFWDANWTDYETHGELCVLFDDIQSNGEPYYEHMKIIKGKPMHPRREARGYDPETIRKLDQGIIGGDEVGEMNYDWQYGGKKYED